MSWQVILLMEEILHQVICGLSDYLQDSCIADGASPLEQWSRHLVWSLCLFYIGDDSISQPLRRWARIPKTSYMGDMFSAMKMDPDHSTSWNVSQGFWWNLGPLLTWLSLAAGPTRSIFHPKYIVILRVPPTSRRPPEKPPGVWGGIWNRKDVRVRFKKKNKGP